MGYRDGQPTEKDDPMTYGQAVLMGVLVGLMVGSAYLVGRAFTNDMRFERHLEQLNSVESEKSHAVRAGDAILFFHVDDFKRVQWVKGEPKGVRRSDAADRRVVSVTPQDGWFFHTWRFKKWDKTTSGPPKEIVMDTCGPTDFCGEAVREMVGYDLLSFD